MLKNMIRLTGALVVLAFAHGSALAAGDIVDTAYVVAAMKRGAILWDARDADAYRQGHIPGAVNVGDIGRALRDPNRENWLPTPTVETILGQAGIDIAGKEVITYSRKGDSYAHFGLTTIRYYGGKHGKVYYGGLDDWKAAGKPVATEPTKLAPIALKLAPQTDVVIWNADMLARVKAGNVQIVDVRTPSEFRGDDIRAIRGGHVPGAINIPYEQNWADPATAGKLSRGEVKTRDGMALRSTDELRKLYEKLDASRETVVYCQSGVRASETVNVLRELGFADVKLYKPSWLGYAAMLDAPAENETFVNVGALNARIADLQSRLEDIEAQFRKN